MNIQQNKICKEYYQTRMKNASSLHHGLDRLFYSAYGSLGRYIRSEKALLKKAMIIYDASEKLRGMTDNDLRNKLESFRFSLRCSRQNAYEIQYNALAYLVEAADRCLGLRPFPVQIMGSIALLQGFLAEMATGEGKSLTAALAATIAGWSGKPCHIITANDYLAARDSTIHTSFYNFCHLSVESVTGETSQQDRMYHYSKDIVYTTSKEILADFLRDRIKLGPCHHPGLRLIKSFKSYSNNHHGELVMRGLGTAIVDEADSVLIDEAVTPLIISKPLQNKGLSQAIKTAQKIITELEQGIHYTFETKNKEIRLTSKGKKIIKNESKQLPGIWQGSFRQEEIILLCLQAKEFFQRDRHYVIQEQKVVIVDEFTGRLMPNRKWSHGIHQAVESKEGLELTDPMVTLARLSFQRFFRFFPKLSGMTGTAKEATGEFWHIYKLPVISIPTNRPCIRKQLPDQVFSTLSTKISKVIQEIIKIHKSGRPVLVGTRNVETSEHLSQYLLKAGLDCQVINAVRHKEEAHIVGQAGKKGKITIATNMAGRGTDIKLGPGVEELGGLHVIATERHESARIDRQLFGRSARQGNAGSAQAFLCMEDELIQRFVPKFIQKGLDIPFVYTGEKTRIIGKILYNYSQKIAERLAYNQRRNVLQNDKLLSEALFFTGSDIQFK
jgi:preprotein translocase subunit SecA